MNVIDSRDGTNGSKAFSFEIKRFNMSIKFGFKSIFFKGQDSKQNAESSVVWMPYYSFFFSFRNATNISPIICIVQEKMPKHSNPLKRNENDVSHDHHPEKRSRLSTANELLSMPVVPMQPKQETFPASAFSPTNSRQNKYFQLNKL